MYWSRPKSESEASGLFRVIFRLREFRNLAAERGYVAVRYESLRFAKYIGEEYCRIFSLYTVWKP